MTYSCVTRLMQIWHDLPIWQVTHSDLAYLIAMLPGHVRVAQKSQTCVRNTHNVFRRQNTHNISRRVLSRSVYTSRHTLPQNLHTKFSPQPRLCFQVQVRVAQKLRKCVQDREDILAQCAMYLRTRSFYVRMHRAVLAYVYTLPRYMSFMSWRMQIHCI